MFNEELINKSLFFCETLETRITRPLLGKEVVLYHGSPYDLEVIKAVSVNTGTRLSTERYSSFWCLNERFPLLMAISGHLSTILKENNIKYPEAITFDMVNKTIVFSPKYSKLMLKELKNKKFYLYKKKLPTKIVGRGHDVSVGEFTVDIDVIPDTKDIFRLQELLNKDLIYICKDKNEFDKYFNDFANGRKHKSSLIDELVYRPASSYSQKYRERRNKYYNVQNEL